MNKNLESTTKDSYRKLDLSQNEELSDKEQKTHNPPFYKIVDYLFAKATHEKYATDTKDVKKIQESKPQLITNAKKSAAKWGGLCTAGLLTGFYGGLAAFAPEHYQSVGWAWDALAATALTGGVIYTTLSDEYKDWKKDHPVYMSGMSSAVKAGYAVSAADLLVKFLL